MGPGGCEGRVRKVFCIGFHKTGTTSMKQALRILGYRVTGPNNELDRDIAEKLGPLTEELSHRYDAFQDNPWPLVYREMDTLHPGSKFILTERDEDRWYASIRNHFRGKSTPMRKLVYGEAAGGPRDNEALYKARMRRHNQEVRDYFRDRPDDLFVLDVTRDGRWEPLCAFLGHPVPDVPFPHANKLSYSFLPRVGNSLRWRGWILLHRMGLAGPPPGRASRHSR
jgi:Sulfotransferase domain